MKNSTKAIVIGVATVVTLTLGVGTVAYATSDNTIKSKGVLQYDGNGDGDYTDSEDVVFDASDFVVLDAIIEDSKEGKTAIIDSLNSYPNVSVDELDTFSNLATVIDTLTKVPKGYYYDKATEGENCQRYVLEDGDYYPCDMYGTKTSDTPLTGDVSVVSKNSTSKPAAGEIQLVKYVSANESNISAGYAGYAEKELILGSGADNIEYVSSGAHFFDRVFPDYTMSLSHQTSYTYNAPSVVKTADYWESYIGWGLTAFSIAHATNCIDYDSISRIEIDYVASPNNGANTFYCISSSGSTLASCSLYSTGKTTTTIDTSSFSGMGRFQISQSVSGATNEGYSTKVRIYDIRLIP